MPPRRGAGRRAPLSAAVAFALAVALLPSAVLGAGAEWTTLERVSPIAGSRLDSLHQLASDQGSLHLVHPRLGPERSDDHVVYQRSRDGGETWTAETPLFAATASRRHVVPNLAIDARAGIVAVAFRVNGPEDDVLYVRVSRDGGSTFGAREELFTSSDSSGIGVPAVAVGVGFVAVAWTDRASGKVQLRVSRDEGRSFGRARTFASTKLSIDCRKRVTDGLVGLAAAGRSLHLAWSHAPKRACQAAAIRVRSSLDRGATWSKARTITDRRSYGWPELSARNKTVVATVQAPTGGLIVARSLRQGRGWRDRLIRPAKGHSLSAGDITLLPEGRALLTYVDERLRKDRLVSTKLVSRRSPDAGASWKAPKTVASSAQRLRMAPNVAVVGKEPTIVVQHGPLDGSRRNIFASRLR